MDPAAKGITADKANNPQDEENDGYRPKHGGLLIESFDRPLQQCSQQIDRRTSNIGARAAYVL